MLLIRNILKKTYALPKYRKSQLGLTILQRKIERINQNWGQAGIKMFWNNNFNYFYFSSTQKKSELLLKQLQGLKQSIGQKDINYLKKMNQLAIAYINQKELEKSIDIYKQIVSKLKLSSKDPRILTEFLKSIQILLCQVNRFQESISYEEQYIQLKIKQFGQNCKEVAKQYNLLAQICFKSHKIQKAISNFQKSFSVYSFLSQNQNIQSKYQKEKAQILLNLATCSWSINKKQNAVTYFLKCKQILLAEQIINIDILTSVLMNLSILKELQNSLDQSLKFCQQLQNLLKKHQKSKGIQSLFNQMGKIYLKKRKFQPCQKYLLQAQKIMLTETNNSKIVQTYQILANLYQTKEDKPKALETYQKLLEVVKKVSKHNQNFIANIYNSIGNLFSTMKQFEEARKNYFQSQKLIIALQVKKPEDSYTNQILGDIYYNIGKAFQDEVKPNQAIQWYQKGKKFYQNSKNISNKVKLINVYRGLGLTYFNGPKNKQKTIQNFVKSSQLCEQNYPNHPDLKMQYALIFDSLYNLNKLQQALKICQKIQKINEHELKSNPNNMESLLGSGFQKYFKGLIHYKLNNLKQAKYNLLQASGRFETISSNTKNNKIHENFIYTSILLQELYKIQNKNTQAQSEAKKIQNFTRLAYEKLPKNDKNQEQIQKFIQGAKQYLLKQK